MRIADLIDLENKKLGYKLNGNMFPIKIKEARYLDQNKNSLQKTHNYNIQNKMTSKHTQTKQNDL